MKAIDYLQHAVKRTAKFLEARWFDLSRSVRTCGDVTLPDAGIGTKELQDSVLYQPARPAHIRCALREIPVQDLSSFSFVDLGSGKGRSLFIAAEFPFQQITGVEFSGRLHDEACANIRSFGGRRRGCGNIRSLHENAKDFVFPEGNMVVYFFNPFGPETMQRVLDNLTTSLKLHPRHVIIVLIWPRLGGDEQVAALDGMHLRRKSRQYQIFEAPVQPNA